MINKTENENLKIDFNKVISLGLDWVVNSGIINKENDVKKKGGVYAWYEPDEKKFSYLYSEITGYMITFLVYFFHKTGDKKYLKLAEDCARWLTKISYFKPTQGVFCRYYPESGTFRRQICTFDNGIVLNGLVNLYKVSKILSLREIIENLDKKIKSNFKTEKFCLHRYLPDEKRFEEEASPWSHQGGSFLLKSAMGILNQGLDKDGIGLVKNICEKVIRMQEEDGRFITDKFKNNTYLHPHCYALEGLTVAGVALKRKDFLEAARKGVEWIIKEQLPSGGFPNQFSNNKFSSSESIDIDSQVMRLWTIHDSLNLISLDAADYAKGIKNIMSFQNSSKEKIISGGFRYGTDIEGKQLNHINTWGSLFALQALDMIKESLNKSFSFKPFLLV